MASVASTRDVALARALVDGAGDEEDANDVTPVPVLFINGDAVSADDLLKWIRLDLERMAQTMDPAQYDEALVNVLQRVIRDRAESQLLYQQARRRLSEQELEGLEGFVDQRIRDTINTEHAGRESRYQNHLRERGITPAEDRDRIRREILVAANVQRTIEPKIVEPTRHEIEQYHEQYVRELRSARHRRMFLIDVPFGRTDAAGMPAEKLISRDVAHGKITLAQQELQAGGDFAEVARQYSDGVNALAGGDWGDVRVEGVRPRWAAAVETVFSLEEGQTSGIIETDDAFFIVKCTGIEEPEIRSFAEMQPELIESYRNHQFERLTRAMIADLHEKAVIRPANAGRFLAALVEAAPKPSASSGRPIASRE